MLLAWLMHTFCVLLAALELLYPSLLFPPPCTPCLGKAPQDMPLCNVCLSASNHCETTPTQMTAAAGARAAREKGDTREEEEEQIGYIRHDIRLATLPITPSRFKRCHIHGFDFHMNM